MGSEAQMESSRRSHCELHACLSLTMRLCRSAGVFPVDGLNKPSITGLRFNLRSIYVIYYFLTLYCQAMLAGLSVYNFFVMDYDLSNLTSLIFYSSSLTSAIFLIKLARNWPKLMQKAERIENSVVAIRSRSKQNKCNKITCFIMILALTEHLLSVTFKVQFIMNMNEHFELSLAMLGKYYMMNTLVFKYTSYSEWKALLYEMAIIQSTFLWNFTDAMTVCFSLYLTSYFNDLNKIIERPEKNKETTNWQEIRIYYSYLVELVHEIDHKICCLILLSLFTNLFFICVQLFNVMKPMENTEYLIYYSYSFLFLFIRTIVTSLLAANVNTAARRPLFTLQYLPNSEYSIDVQRFIRQIRYTTTALSGFFFYITRGMILTVIGSVVKYELVLLQWSLRNFEITEELM